MFSPYDRDVLVLQVLDVAWPYEAVDHKSDQPIQVATDHGVAIDQVLTTLAANAGLDGDALAYGAFGCLRQLLVFHHGEAAAWLVCDLDGWCFGNIHDETLCLCVRQNLANSHKVLLDSGGRKTVGTELLHKVAQLRVVDLANLQGAEVGQDCFLQAVLQNSQPFLAQFTSSNTTLLYCQCSCHNIGKFHGLVLSLDYLFAIQLGCFDMEELFGGTDGRLLVGSFEALCISLAFEKTARLPIPTGIGEKDA